MCENDVIMSNNEFVVPVNPPEKKCFPDWKSPCTVAKAHAQNMSKAKLDDFILSIYLFVTRYIHRKFLCLHKSVLSMTRSKDLRGDPVYVRRNPSHH